MYEGFEEFFPEKKVYGQYGVNILKDGIVTVNQRLRNIIGDSKVRFFINETADKIIIKLSNDEHGFKLNKAGRFRNCRVLEKAKRKKMIFPVHYTLIAKEDSFQGELDPVYDKKLRDK